MTVRVYRSTDTGAPVLDATIAGSLITLLKACLVTGYDVLPGAGWTNELEDTGNHKIILRNSSSTGSGRYFRIRDDGLQETVQSTPNYYIATITGCNNYTDIDTLLIPFPRTITGVDRHNNTWYGSPIYKSTAAYAAVPWIVIADEKTCHFISALTNSALDSSISQSGVSLQSFGDLKLFADVVNYPKAFIHTRAFPGTDYYAYPAIGVQGTTNGYMEHCLENSSAGTLFYVCKGFSTDAAHDKATSTITASNGTVPYPHPITGGLGLEMLTLADDTNNVVRTTKHTVYITERFATYPGLYGCLHSTISSLTGYKVCDPFDTVNASSRNYLVFPVAEAFSAHRTVAIDMTGPW